METENPRKTVLFICKHNSARSQMAEGLLNALCGHLYRASSAGTHPSSLNPYAVKAMAERGIDISMNESKSLNEFKGVEFDYVVIVCEGDTCPYFPGGKIYIHHTFKDPTSVRGDEDYRIKTFISVRDELELWIKETFKCNSYGTELRFIS